MVLSDDTRTVGENDWFPNSAYVLDCDISEARKGAATEEEIEFEKSLQLFNGIGNCN